MRVSERNAGRMILSMEPHPGKDIGPDLLPPLRESGGIDFSNCPLADRDRQKLAERARITKQKVWPPKNPGRRAA